MGTYLEDYLESIYMLPSEVKRNFELMRELDKATSGLLDELRDSQARLIRDAREKIKKRCNDTTLPEPNEDELNELINGTIVNEGTYNKKHLIIQKMDEKVAIASQSYDLIDHHIRRLDNDLENYTSILKSNGEYEDEKLIPQKKQIIQLINPSINSLPLKKSTLIPLTIQKNKTGRKRTAIDAQLDTIPETISIQSNITMDDLPIDPNEPLYCHCRRISYGQMIGCDNEDCKFEWFHFDCVGLTEQPTGAWYCKDCSTSAINV